LPQFPHFVLGAKQCAPGSVVVVDVGRVIVVLVVPWWPDVVVVVFAHTHVVVVVVETSPPGSVVDVVVDGVTGAQSSRDRRGLTRRCPNSSVTVVATSALRRQRTV